MATLIRTPVRQQEGVAQFDLQIPNRDRLVATVQQGPGGMIDLVLGRNEHQKTFSVTGGIREGTTTLTALERFSRCSTSIQVIVRRDRVPCNPDGTYDVNFRLENDPGGNAPFIDLEKAILTISQRDGQVTVGGSHTYTL